MTNFLPTVHFNGEDALVAAGSDRASDAGFTEQHSSLVSVLLILAHIHPAHLALETRVVEGVTCAQSDLLKHQIIFLSIYKKHIVCLLIRLQPFKFQTNK